MKYPPRFASRQLPPREPQPAQPRRLLAGALFLAGFAIAVLGAFHDVGSTGKEPATHIPSGSPLPTAGDFQVLGNPQPTLSTEASPSPTAALQLRQQQQAVVATPLAPLYAANQGNPSPVQNWSSASVLTPGAAATAPVMAVAPSPAAQPQTQATATPTPTPSSTPTPTLQPSASPTPTPKPSPTSTPQPSTTPTPTPQPSATAGSPSCVATKLHPCNQRGEN